MSLSFTVIDVSNGTKIYVWLEDGNVLYLRGKHIPLFLASTFYLFILFIPYTLSITLGPWLQKKTQYRVFFWVLKLKPLFDAHYGPLKDECRYWTGILLLSRMVLSVVSAVNVLGDDKINLLAIITLTFVLMALLWQSGGVYKTWAFSLLDSFFLFNLGVLASVTLYNKFCPGNQYTIVCISIGSVFAVSCLTLLYHCIKKLSKLKCVASILKRMSPSRPLLDVNNVSADCQGSDVDSDEEMLIAIDIGRNPETCTVDTY